MKCSVCGKEKVFEKAQEEGWSVCPFVEGNKHAYLTFCSVACGNKYNEEAASALATSGYEEEGGAMIVTATKGAANEAGK